MSLSSPELPHRGVPLLAQHLESLDPEAVSARARLDERLGPELARKLVIALAPRCPAKAR